MLEAYIGQQDRLMALEAAVSASKAAGTPLPHMLILGRSGHGKTHLARCIANEMQLPFAVLHAPSIVEKQDITARILEADGGILFIDEIHALDKKICEDLYTVIDDATITEYKPVMVEKWEPEFIEEQDELPENQREDWFGPGIYDIPVQVASSHRTVVRRPISVTIIGATTDESLLPTPFYNRLSQLKVHLREYTNVELATIGIMYADDLGVLISNEAALFMAERALSTPRRMKQLIDRASDFGRVNLKNAKRAVKALGIDPLGLEHPHRDILRVLSASKDGLSRTSLGQILALPPKNLEHYWTDLLRLNLVTVDTRHRVTLDGKEHIQGSY